MKAILNNDIILKFTINGGIDVGEYKDKKILSELRFDGNKIVNLNDLDILWIEDKGKFVFHCKDIGNCVAVKMKYSDRNNLVLRKGKYKILSAKRKGLEKLSQDNSTVRNRRQKKLNRKFKSYHVDINALVMMLAKKVMGSNEYDQKINLIINAWDKINKEENYKYR